MRKEGTHRKPPRRSRCNGSNAASEKKSERPPTEVGVKALAKKEIERRLRHYEKLRHG